ncbi:hypothetical protein F2P81_000269 [Scophthalmus maximus]|uniref:Uncharacterized protein n=1 Tax=Scophthalmus maximus TaxID=52904 RepID=A0A6A4TGC5_SCOMX|nr:hypothetical protein F2P81_000269 [Scophthalmus maximus]
MRGEVTVTLIQQQWHERSSSTNIAIGLEKQTCTRFTAEVLETYSPAENGYTNNDPEEFLNVTVSLVFESVHYIWLDALHPESNETVVVDEDRDPSTDINTASQWTSEYVQTTVEGVSASPQGILNRSKTKRLIAMPGWKPG